MKCSNCGGEVPSYSEKCPYCGTVNPEGAAFREEVQRRMEKNRLLRPFLRKQKTPEFVQKLMTRIFVILTAVNVLIVAFCLVLVLFFYDGSTDTRSAQKDSIAEQYIHTFHADEYFYYDDFIREMNKVIDKTEKGEMSQKAEILRVIDAAHKALRYGEGESSVIREEMDLLIDAFFQGYLGLSENAMLVFAPDENGEYGYSPNEILLEMATEEALVHLQEVIS